MHWPDILLWWFWTAGWPDSAHQMGVVEHTSHIKHNPVPAYNTIVTVGLSVLKHIEKELHVY